MAGMPQAQTFAGGLQGYSSAPLYEQSLDKLFANAPAQYNAMNSMFIDPFTGARPQGNYAASPTQVSQMSSGNGGGYVSPTPTPDFTPALDGGTGYWSGGEKTGMQTNLMTGDEYEAYVLAHGLPPEGDTFMDGLRGFGRSFVNDGLIGKLYESATGNPIMQRDLESTDPNYYPTMSGNESSFYPVGGSANNTAANRYGVQDDVLRNDMYLAAARQEADIQAAQQKREDDLIYEMMLGEDLTPLIQGGLLNTQPVVAAKQPAPYVAPVAKSTVNSNGNGTGARQRDAKGNATKGGAVTSSTTGKNTTGKSF
jgi:hypothetical protein